MKIIIEKEEANEIKFEPNKNYLVLKDFSHSHPLGSVTVFVENNIMFANIGLSKDFSGYPSIMYDNKGNEKNLVAIGICSNPNLDESIKPINYIPKQLDGKPSNLKTK